MNTTFQSKGVINIIGKIYQASEKQYDKATNAEEKAFYFGQMNITGALLDGFMSTKEYNNNRVVHINFDYAEALNKYKEDRKNFDEETMHIHQLTIDDVIKALQSYQASLKPKKPTEKTPVVKKIIKKANNAK